MVSSSWTCLFSLSAVRLSVWFHSPCDGIGSFWPVCWYVVVQEHSSNTTSNPTGKYWLRTSWSSSTHSSLSRTLGGSAALWIPRATRPKGHRSHFRRTLWGWCVQVGRTLSFGSLRRRQGFWYGLAAELSGLCLTVLNHHLHLHRSDPNQFHTARVDLAQSPRAFCQIQ